MSTYTPCDPARRSASAWSALQASLKARGAPDTDPRVIEARQGLAFWRAQKAIARERGLLSPSAVDRLRAALGEAVAR
ncbi:hypothetical protein P5V78_04380 [Mycobacteroides abscessus subsp. abscessus]|uniref:hypothetical protein n=1 Tax=Mycobacteroides abscessus TaxID=36809 RepID=UPI0009408589|nr:hypothetical protein [Mycobacteroides abscessus]MBN7403650.1 hypothetical protein [Mycobacteroides abscessus subsp. abscessus]MDO3087208.1 hypothetical protein [Mycobacteroides abscessus subsp. abscessus]MDO3269202.1 hypothetical protein [Mycobacteroides abscessus subsp. abscessus]